MIRIWYLICSLFLLININILIEESYQVVYKMFNQSEPIEHLICFNLKEIITNKTKIKVNEIKNEFNYNFKKKIEINLRNGNSISNNKIEIILNQLGDYFIYQDRVCFILRDRKHYRLTDLSNKLQMNVSYFVFNNDTFTFLKLNAYFSFNQLSVKHKEYPYSYCSKDYSNFKCLNDKIKKIQRLSRYYYRSDDNKSIELNYLINQTIIDNEIKTIKECNQIDCTITFFFHNVAIYNPESITLKSFLYISKQDFYLQFIGLFVLFLNIPIYQFVIKLNNYLKPVKIKFLKLKLINCIKLKLKFERLSKLKYLKYLESNNLILLITFICLSILFIQSISNFIAERDYPSMKSVSLNSIRSRLSIVICVDIGQIKENRYNIYNRSLLELKKDTDNGLNIILKDVYLKFLNEKIQTKWQLESKLILFYYKRRCFQIRISLDKTNYYQNIFSATELIIEFNKRKFAYVYILTDNEIFNSRTFRYNLCSSFKKRILERSKLNKLKKCRNYNLINDNCNSKWNCFDRCMNRNIYNQFQNFTAYSFIDKNHFTDKEWSNIFLEPKYNQFYYKFAKECEDKYSKLDQCIDIKFERQSEISCKRDSIYEIDLNYEIIYHKEDEPSIFKLLLDLLNIQINLIGLNFYKCFFMILALFKLNLKLIKIFKLLIYLICSIGFTIHLWSIYDEIMNIEIIFSEHYELINKIEMPNLIFCSDFNQTKINPNYKLTYEYLDKIAKELTEDKIFNQIEYLNKSNEWIKLDNKTNFQDNNLKIKIFYYLDKKCFKIIQNMEYNRNQFEFNDKINSDDGLVIKILFNRIYLADKIFYFFTKNNKKIQFSKIDQFNLTSGFPNGPESYKIKHEIIKIDKFELIKNPLSFNEDQNDLDEFLNKFINYFETKSNFVTLKLPFEKTNLNLKKEIDDNLFIKLYNQQHDQFNSNFINIRHSYNYLEINSYQHANADFKFSLSFYRKVIAVSNKISLIKLIINLLNVLSFWFDLGILDLYNYLFIIKLFTVCLQVYMYKFLIKIKNKLLLIIFEDFE